MADPRPPSAPGGLTGIISQLLTYIDRPWKAAVIVGLFLVGGAGWIFYTHQDQFIENWLTPSMPSLKMDTIPDALDQLAAESGADLIQVWSIDLPSNSQTFVAARRSDGERPVVPSPRTLAVITRVSDAEALVEVLHGSPVCVDMRDTGTPLARRLRAVGIKRGCAVPIPPDPSALVGVIYLGWREAKDAGVEEVAVKVARGIAAKMATH